jgi:hypothetical protein
MWIIGSIKTGTPPRLKTINKFFYSGRTAGDTNQNHSHLQTLKTFPFQVVVT